MQYVEITVTLEAANPAFRFRLALCPEVCMKSYVYLMFFVVHPLCALLSFVLCVYLQAVWKMICRTPPLFKNNVNTPPVLCMYALLCFAFHVSLFAKRKRNWKRLPSLPTPVCGKQVIMWVCYGKARTPFAMHYVWGPSRKKRKTCVVCGKTFTCTCVFPKGLQW